MQGQALKKPTHLADTTNMQGTHYLTNIAPGMFYVLTYRPDTKVRILILESDTKSEYQACRIMRAMHGGEWEPADSGQAAWSRTIVKVDGSAEAFPMPPKGWGVVSI